MTFLLFWKPNYNSSYKDHGSLVPSSSVAMVSVVTAAVAVSYGGYMLWKKRQKQQQRKTHHEHYVELLSLEKGMLKHSPLPIMTMTWFKYNNPHKQQQDENDDGYFKTLVPILRRRIQSVLNANPWLQGTFVEDSNTAYIAYPNYTQVDDFLVLLNPDDCEESPMAYDRPLEENTHNLYKYNCNNNNNKEKMQHRPKEHQSSLVLQAFQDQNQPFWRVALIPCRSNPKTHFAIVISMSHVAGDGHTFYGLYEQLLHHGEEKSSDIKPCLIADRILNTADVQLDYMNQINVLGTPGFVACMIRGVLCQSLFGDDSLLRRLYLKLCYNKYQLSTASPYRMKTRVVLLDSNKLTIAKKIAMKDTTSNSTTAGNNKGDVSFVSTNDVITSWFLTNSSCSFGLMAINVRGKLDDHTDQHAGNYENCILYYPPNDTLSPTMIRQSLQERSHGSIADTKPAAAAAGGGGGGGGISDAKKSTFSNWNLAKSDLALITNWSTFAPFRRHCTDVQGKDIATVLPDCEQLFHAPALDFNTTMPPSLVSCCIFQATHNQLGMILCAKKAIMEELDKTLIPMFA
jgi:hypothetical protein